MKKYLLPIIASLFIYNSNFCQNINVTLASKVTYPGLTLANCWGWKNPKDGKEYALVGTSAGLSIVDVSNPTAAYEVTKVAGPNSIWREVRTYDNHAYVTTEGGGGLQIIDLSNLPNTNPTVVNWTPTINGKQLSSIHALQVDNGKIYLYGSNIGNKGAIIADLKTDPANPVYLGSYDKRYIHDGYVRNDTLYACHIYDGDMEVVDCRNPAACVALGDIQTPGKFTHNSWLSTDSKTCFTTDEVNDSYLTAYNVSDLQNITLMDKIQSNPGSKSVVHNTYIIRKNNVDYAVTSWYKDGITIVNASDPSNLVQVGNYDTSPLSSGAGEDGCWGVYPFLPSGVILASDMQEGLFVLYPTYESDVTEETTGDVKVLSYPNPFITDVKVTIQSPSLKTGNRTLSLALFDVCGKKVRAINSENGSHTFNISRNNLVSGVYFYKINNNNKTIAAGKICAR